MIRDPNALQAENIMAYDNAVSALGKICQFHRDSIDSAQVGLLSSRLWTSLVKDTVLKDNCSLMPWIQLGTLIIVQLL